MEAYWSCKGAWGISPYKLNVVEAMEEDENIQVGVGNRLQHVWTTLMKELLGISYPTSHDGLPHLLPCRQLFCLLLWPALQTVVVCSVHYWPCTCSTVKLFDGLPQHLLWGMLPVFMFTASPLSLCSLLAPCQMAGNKMRHQQELCLFAGV